MSAMTDRQAIGARSRACSTVARTRTVTRYVVRKPSVVYAFSFFPFGYAVVAACMYIIHPSSSLGLKCSKEDGANQIRRSLFVRLFAPVFSFYMAHDFLLIIVVSLLFMSMLREWIMILILTQKGGCDCGFVISYCLLLLMTLIPLPGYIPSFPDVKR